MIRGITFDFWQTLFYDPHEAQRMRLRAAGMAAVLRDHGRYVPPATVLASILACGRHRTVLADACEREFTPMEQVRWVLSDLGICLPAAGLPRILTDAAVPYCEGSLAKPPEIFEAAPAVLATLARDYSIGLICNTGASPGVVLRNVLHRAGLLSFFGVTIFSDEIGWRKPHLSVFAAAADGLGLGADECVHIGDDPWTDGHGAKLAGFSAIVLTGGMHAARPQPSTNDTRATGPDVKIAGLTDLPGALAALNRRDAPGR